LISHNTDPTQTYKVGINDYSEFTNDEFMSYYNLQVPQQDCSATHTPSKNLKNLLAVEVPDTWDWRDHNGVTPVKD